MSVVKDLGLPVKFIGVGEKIDDLRDFEPEMFVDALLGNNEETSVKMKARVNRMLNISPVAEVEVGNKISGKKESVDPTERLRASFGVGAGAGASASSGNSDEDEEVNVVDGVSGSKPKRRKNKPTPKKSKK